MKTHEAITLAASKMAALSIDLHSVADAMTMPEGENTFSAEEFERIIVSTRSSRELLDRILPLLERAWTPA